MTQYKGAKRAIIHLMATEARCNFGRVNASMHESLVTAALDLLTDSGPGEIKVGRCIAETAGISTMAIYHHFGGLLELS